MSTISERIPVLVSKTQKQNLVAKAKAAGLSTGEFLRRAGENYTPSEEEDLLTGMLDQILKITAQTEKTIDESLAFVDASEQRLAKLGFNLPQQ